MKRLALFSILLLAALLTFAACGDDEEEPTSAEGGEAVSLVGRWEGRWEGETGVPNCSQDTLVLVITSEENGTFVAEVDGGCGGRFPATGTISGLALDVEGSAALGTITYTGELRDGGRRMEGEWSVSGTDFRGSWEVEKVSDEPGTATTPEASPTEAGEEETETPSAGERPGGGGGIPEFDLPPGAELVSRATLQAPGLPVPVPLPGTLPEVEVAEYTSPQSADEVMAFFEDEFGGWTRSYSLDTPEQKVAAFQREAAGGAEVVLIVAQDEEEGSRFWTYAGTMRQP